MGCVNSSVEELEIEECMFLCAEGILPSSSSKLTASTDIVSATTSSSHQQLDDLCHETPRLYKEQHEKWHQLLQHQRKQEQKSLQQTLNFQLFPKSPSSMTSSSANSPSSPFLKMYEKSLRGELGASDDER